MHGGATHAQADPWAAQRPRPHRPAHRAAGCHKAEPGCGWGCGHRPSKGRPRPDRFGSAPTQTRGAGCTAPERPILPPPSMRRSPAPRFVVCDSPCVPPSSGQSCLCLPTSRTNGRRLLGGASPGLRSAGLIAPQQCPHLVQGQAPRSLMTIPPGATVKGQALAESSTSSVETPPSSPLQTSPGLGSTNFRGKAVAHSPHNLHKVSISFC